MSIYLGVRGSRLERKRGGRTMAMTLGQGGSKAGAQVGRSVPRLESRDKVTGRAEYIHTMRLPGMLHAKIFRSTVAHGRIRSVDTSAAKKVPGVLHVVTIDDVLKVLPDPYYGPAFHDQPILAHEKVRFVGEPVAAVIATDPHVADEAVQLITADYEELPAVYDEVEALTTNVYVHEELKPAGAFADLKHLKGAKDTNVALGYSLRRGDFDKAYAPPPSTSSSTSSAPRRCCTCRSSRSPASATTRTPRSRSTIRRRGPRSCAARWRGCSAGRKTRCASRCPMSARATAPSSTSSSRRWRSRFDDRAQAGEDRLHLRGDVLPDHQAPCTFRIKSGVDKDGRIVARKCEVFWNGGAYADIGPRVTQKAGLTASGPYDIDNVSIDSYALYTNLTPAGALRGFGVPQLVWAYEGHMDMMARALNLDPVEFRRKNLMREAASTPPARCSRMLRSRR